MCSTRNNIFLKLAIEGSKYFVKEGIKKPS
jgi:hypothetical protein